MKKQIQKADHNNENPKKKTPLDKFKLFYEEIPLEVNMQKDKPQSGSKERLVRKTKQ